jgi:hypothetical protein
VAVSFIIGNLNKDVVVRNQLLTMMPREYVGDILMAKEDFTQWLDHQIPAHQKKMKQL